LAELKGEFAHAITVGLKFRRSDAFLLWRLAARHWPKDTYGDVSKFAEAAQAAENGTLCVVQCGNQEQLNEIVGFFPLHGITRPEVHDMRIEIPKGAVLL
jgi:hypothetical protein